MIPEKFILTTPAMSKRKIKRHKAGINQQDGISGTKPEQQISMNFTAILNQTSHKSIYRNKYKINILQAYKNFLILIKEIHE
ncbi:hypothetical protein [Desulfobacter sp.]|uniref:hypothetical protein n=1 Tax=Desulfobacter sp. TaxID=2294 RepID=UPI003D0CBDDA